ncbi:MAG: MerR family transcriptional regulator [Faecalibacterium sp.]
MIYTVGEMAQKLGVPASTLRYYDKEGLLPFVERSSGGIRMFRENDFEWLQVIRCMKKAGMSIKDIRQYIELSMQETTPLTPGWKCSGISGKYSPSRSSSYSTRWRPWSINAGSMKPPKPLGRWMSPVR